MTVKRAVKEIHSVWQLYRIMDKVNAGVPQKQRNKNKHTFSIGVCFRLVDWALFWNCW